MKALITAYTFDASAQQVTFTGINPISLASVLLITNVTDNIIIYNFADSTLGGTVATNVLTLTYNTTTMADGDKLQIWYDDGGTTQNVASLPTKTVGQINDWTAVAQNVVAQSSVLDCSAMSLVVLHISAFLDTETAHTGTEFIVQTSSSASGNEDWVDSTAFVGLIGTANKEDITNNPLAANSTTITCASTTGYTAGAWRAIEDATLVNSELIYQTNLTANTNITVLDGTTNEHANTADLYNIVFCRDLILDPTVQRVRLCINNTYDVDGSTLNYRLRYTAALAL